MHLQSFRSCVAGFLVAALVVAGSAAAAADAPAPAGRWHLMFGTNGASEAELQFRVTPKDGEAILVNVKIAHGRGPLYIAQDMRDAFKAQLPKKRFKTDIVVGNELVLKAGPGEPDFTLELIESAAPGPKIHITRG